jgi:hypothetical protein
MSDAHPSSGGSLWPKSRRLDRLGDVLAEEEQDHPHDSGKKGKKP